MRVFCIANFSPAYFDIEIYRSNRKSSFSYRIFQYVYDSIGKSTVSHEFGCLANWTLCSLALYSKRRISSHCKHRCTATCLCVNVTSIEAFSLNFPPFSFSSTFAATSTFASAATLEAVEISAQVELCRFCSTISTNIESANC